MSSTVNLLARSGVRSGESGQEYLGRGLYCMRLSSECSFIRYGNDEFSACRTAESKASRPSIPGSFQLVMMPGHQCAKRGTRLQLTSHLCRLLSGSKSHRSLLKSDALARSFADAGDTTPQTLRVVLVGPCKGHVARRSTMVIRWSPDATFLGIGKQFCNRIGSVSWQKKTVKRPTALV